MSFLRYTVLAGPGVYALLAGMNFPPRKSLRDGIAWLTIAMLTAINLQSLTQPVVSEQDYKGLAQQMALRARPGDLFVFYGSDPWLRPGLTYLAIRYYQPVVSMVQGQDPDHPWLLLEEPANPALQERLKSFTSLWLIHSKNEDAARIIPGWRVTETQEFQSIGRLDHLAPEPNSKR